MVTTHSRPTKNVKRAYYSPADLAYQLGGIPAPITATCPIYNTYYISSINLDVVSHW